MSEIAIRLKTWPLAVAGSLLVHAGAITSAYLAPVGGGTADLLAKAGTGNAAAYDTAPLYLIPDELPADIAAKLAAEQEAAAKREVADRSPPPADAERELAQKPPVPDPIKVQLGIENGPKLDTDTWMNNASPLEHGAEQAKVNQPQKDLDAKPAPLGVPGEDGNGGKNKTADRNEQAASKPQPAAEKPAPLVEAPKVPAVSEPAPPAPSTTLAAVPQVEVKPASPIPEGPSKTEIKAGNSGGEKPAVEQTASEPKAKPAETVVLGAPAAVQPAGAPPAETVRPADSPEKSGKAGSPGVPLASKKAPADRDSDAASVKRSAVFRNGKVEAGEGLDIRTKRPEFDLTTRALLRPQSPTLEIVFGKDGRAKNVRVLKSSGYPAEVDGPVITALYNWRASGKVLNELPPGPGSTVALEITILLQ